MFASQDPNDFLNKLNAYRETYDYPRLVALFIALYHLLWGALNFVSASTFLAPLTQITGGTRSANYLIGFLVGLGGLSILFAVLFLVVALGVFLKRHGIYLPAIVLNFVWVLFVLGSSVRNVEGYFSLVASTAVVLLLVLDPRVQAAFGRGKYAEAYWKEGEHRRRG